MTPEQLRECPIDQCVENTDREIYRGPDDGCGDFYSDSLHITQEGALGINCGGYVIVRPIRAWHGIAKAHAAALEELAKVEAALAECRAKLEVDPRTKYDGIACRDETIRLQDEEIERLNKAWKAQQFHLEHEEKESELQAQRAERAEAALAESERKCERLKFHAGGMAYCCEALEMALTKAASIYANRVTLNIDDFLPLTKAYADYRAEFKEES